MNRALMGKRVLLTRTAKDNDAWAKQLQAAGLVPIGHPCITQEDLDAGGPLATSLAMCTWLVLPSPKAVRRVAKLATVPAHVQIACVGPASAEAAEVLLGRCDLVAERGTIAGLSAELAARILQNQASPPTILIAGAEAGIDTSDNLLREAGANVQRLATYRTTPTRLESGQAPVDLNAMGLDAILLGSPSALVGLLNTANVDEASGPILTLGPTTSDAVRAAGLREPVEAKAPSLDGLLEALADLFPLHNFEAS